MLQIKISEYLRDKWPLTTIGSVNCEVEVRESDDELKEESRKVSENIRNNLKIQDINALPPIRE